MPGHCGQERHQRCSVVPGNTADRLVDAEVNSQRTLHDKPPAVIGHCGGVLQRGVVAACQISYARGISGLRVVTDLGRSSAQSITSRSAVDAAAVVCDPIVARESIGIVVPKHNVADAMM